MLSGFECQSFLWRLERNVQAKIQTRKLQINSLIIDNDMRNNQRSCRSDSEDIFHAGQDDWSNDPSVHLYLPIKRDSHFLNVIDIDLNFVLWLANVSDSAADKKVASVLDPNHKLRFSTQNVLTQISVIRQAPPFH